VLIKKFASSIFQRACQHTSLAFTFQNVGGDLVLYTWAIHGEVRKEEEELEFRGGRGRERFWKKGKERRLEISERGPE
jgi:hypothetical protein